MNSTGLVERGVKEREACEEDATTINFFETLVD